jgi:hypothetical protein
VEPEKTPGDRASAFIEDLATPTWQPSRDQVLWVVRIALALAILLAILTLIGLPFGITLWAWLKLLIVPVVLAIGGFLFTRSENRATQAVAERRAQDEALQAYLDQIGQLLLDKERPLRQSKVGDEVRILARARTLTVVTRLDSFGIGSAMRFLYESGLIGKDNPVVDLKSANLRGAYLQAANLRRVLLQKVYLDDAHLLGADLRGADMQETWLGNATLAGASMQGADLRGAVLEGANLLSADLSDADMAGALGWTPNQLSAARSLKGAIMPDGQLLRDDETSNGLTFADWFKSTERIKGARDNE